MKTCIFSCIKQACFHVFSPFSAYAYFHVFSPFSAYFSLHDILVEKGSLVLYVQMGIRTL